MSYTRLNPTAEDQLLVRSIDSDNYTIEAGSYASVSINPAYSGYTPIGPFGMNVSSGALVLTYSNFYLNPNDGRIYLTLQNRGTASVTTKATVRVLYVKD